jgi:serine/threonine protein kinase
MCRIGSHRKNESGLLITMLLCFSIHSFDFLFFSDADKLSVARTALQGLAYMHERGIVHCDIKPANVFVTSERTGRIGDLDVSRDANERTTQATSQTAASSLTGTFDYMAPELVSKAADFKSDMYSFGLTVFDMFFMPTLDASSGKLNYKRPTLQEQLKSQKAINVAALRQRRHRSR